jgi:hypothetical protein
LTLGDKYDVSEPYPISWQLLEQNLRFPDKEIMPQNWSHTQV